MDNLVFITIFFIFTFFFLLILFSINFLLFSLTFSLEKVGILFLLIFLFFLATLLYIDELLWFLKLYFESICFGVVFFSSLLQARFWNSDRTVRSDQKNLEPFIFAVLLASRTALGKKTGSRANRDRTSWFWEPWLDRFSWFPTSLWIWIL